MTQAIALVGLKSSGKSSVGKLLAYELGFYFIDTDNLLENLYAEQFGEQLAFPAMYKKLGSEKFRALETKVVADIVENYAGQKSVIATGGSTLLQTENRALLEGKASIIYLQASVATLLQRWQIKPPGFLQDASNLAVELAEYYELRASKYEEISDIVVAVDGLSTADVVAKLMLLL